MEYQELYASEYLGVLARARGDLWQRSSGFLSGRVISN